MKELRDTEHGEKNKNLYRSWENSENRKEEKKIDLLPNFTWLRKTFEQKKKDTVSTSREFRRTTGPTLKELRETGEEIKITNSVDLKRPEKGEKMQT
jgi:hypothetical protein